MNHRAGTYQVLNPKTNIINFSNDVSWDNFKPKTLVEALYIHDTEGESSESSFEDDNTISNE